jgi:conjugative transfer region protein TrbK
MSATMGIKLLTRCVAYVALAGALMAAAIALNDRQYLATQAVRAAPAPSSGAGDAELAHCKAIGSEAPEAHSPINRDAQRQCAPHVGR